MTGVFIPDALVVPCFAPFIILRSRGSIPIFSASSSIKVSAANEPIGAPGALYAVVLGLLLTTSYPSILIFSISYGVNMQLEAAPTGEPG